MPVKKATTTKRRTTRRAPAKKPVRRISAASRSRSKNRATIRTVGEGVVGGIAADLLSSSVNLGLNKQLSAALPIIAAAVTERVFKKPAIAAGMAGASAANLLESFGLSLNDAGADMILPDMVNKPEALQDYNYPGLNDGGQSSVYSGYQGDYMLNGNEHQV